MAGEISDQNRDLARLTIDKSSALEKARKIPTAALLGGCLVLLVLLLWLVVPGTPVIESSEVSPASELGVKSTSEKPVLASTDSAAVLHATGYVVAQRRAAVSSKASGTLKELKVIEGDRVKKGDVIGILENDDMQAIVTERQASVEEARARINVVNALLEEATLNKNRFLALKDQKAVSQQVIDESVAQYKKNLAELEASKADLLVREALLSKSKVELSYTYILAPFDGTILTKNADVGEMVTSFASSANAKAAIVTLADMSSLEVEADVSESQISKVYVGQTAEITLDSYPEKVYKGHVNKIVPTVDRAKATILTKIKFDELDEHVIPEMSARVTFQLK